MDFELSDEHRLIRDTGLERLTRDVRVTTIYEGTSEIRRAD
jgi:alkylation response protein AidB-like acyl-CoA dehydrogenase